MKKLLVLCTLLSLQALAGKEDPIYTKKDFFSDLALFDNQKIAGEAIKRRAKYVINSDRKEVLNHDECLQLLQIIGKTNDAEMRKLLCNFILTHEIEMFDCYQLISVAKLMNNNVNLVEFRNQIIAKIFKGKKFDDTQISSVIDAICADIINSENKNEMLSRHQIYAQFIESNSTMKYLCYINNKVLKDGKNPIRLGPSFLLVNSMTKYNDQFNPLGNEGGWQWVFQTIKTGNDEKVEFLLNDILISSFLPPDVLMVLKSRREKSDKKLRSTINKILEKYFSKDQIEVVVQDSVRAFLIQNISKRSAAINSLAINAVLTGDILNEVSMSKAEMNVRDYEIFLQYIFMLGGSLNNSQCAKFVDFYINNSIADKLSFKVHWAYPFESYSLRLSKEKYLLMCNSFNPCFSELSKLATALSDEDEERLRLLLEMPDEVFLKDKKNLTRILVRVTDIKKPSQYKEDFYEKLRSSTGLKHPDDLGLWITALKVQP